MAEDTTATISTSLPQSASQPLPVQVAAQSASQPLPVQVAVKPEPLDTLDADADKIAADYKAARARRNMWASSRDAMRAALKKRGVTEDDADVLGAQWAHEKVPNA